MKKKYLFLGISALVSAFVIGCGGGGGSTPTTTTNSATGYYIDSPVEGIDYTCGNYEGVTGKDGSFKFEKGKNCTFKIKDLTIKTIDGAQLNNDGEKIIETVPKIAALLQTLDIDGDPSNGITLNDEIKNILISDKLISKIDEIDDNKLEEIAEKLAQKTKDYKKHTIKIEDAKKHLQETVKTLLNNKTFYVIEKDNTNAYREISIKDSQYTCKLFGSDDSLENEAQGNLTYEYNGIVLDSPLGLTLTLKEAESKHISFLDSSNKEYIFFTDKAEAKKHLSKDEDKDDDGDSGSSGSNSGGASDDDNSGSSGSNSGDTNDDNSGSSGSNS